MNTLVLLSLFVAAVSAGNVIYTPGHHFGYGYGLNPYNAFHGYNPRPYYGFPGYGGFSGYGGFPGYGAFPFAHPQLVKAEEKAEDEPVAEAGDRKKRDAEDDDKVTAIHTAAPHFAYPYGFAHHGLPYAAHPYAAYPAFPYAAYPAVPHSFVKYEAPEVKTIKLDAPHPYAHFASFPFNFPYVAVAKPEEKAAEEASRKKRDLVLAAPFYGLHAPAVRTYAVKPVEQEHKYKTVSIETDEAANTPAATVLAGLEEKEHTFKTSYLPYPAAYPAYHPAAYPAYHPAAYRFGHHF